MKLHYTLFLSLVVGISAVSSLGIYAQNNENRLEDFTQRNVYLWNETTEDWVIQRSSVYSFSDTGRTVKTELFNLIGQKQHDEETLISYDALGRVVNIEVWSNEFGDDFKFIKQRFEISYYKQTEIVSEQFEYRVRDLRPENLINTIKREFDANDNMTLYLNKTIRGSYDDDSITFEYDEEGKLNEQIQYRWEPISGQFLPWFRSTCNYNGDKLESIYVDFWNLGAEEWTTYHRIVDISLLDNNQLNGKLEGKNAMFNSTIMDGKHYCYDDLNASVDYELCRAIEEVSGCRIEGVYGVDEIWREDYILNCSESMGNQKVEIIEKGKSGNPDKTKTKVYNDFGYPINSLIRHETEIGEKYSGFYGALIIAAGGVVTEAGRSKFEDSEAYSIVNKNHFSKNASVDDRVLIIIKEEYRVETRKYNKTYKEEFFYNGERIYNDVEDINVGDALHVFPNPTREGVLQFMVNGVTGPATVLLVNALGQTVIAEQVTITSGNYQYNKDLKHLERGVYILKISTGNGSLTQKVILQ